MANATSTQLQELYVAYFGRAADPTGLDYWTEKGITTAKFAADMYVQAEFKDAYGSLSTESQVNQIYKNLFDREADVTGLNYWTLQINLGNLKLAEIATHLIWAAQNNSGSSDDKTALSNRTTAAVAYTAKVKESTAAILAFQPASTSPYEAGSNITEAKNYLSGIDKDTASTAAGIAASVTTITTNGVQTATTDETKSYTLTTTADNFTGGTSATTFAGVAGTIDGDTINGGGGADTLNLTVTNADDDNSSFTSSSVETVNIRSTGGTANNADFVDLGFENVSDLSLLKLRRLSDDVEIDNLQSLSTTVEIENVATAADVNINFDASTVTGSSDTANITIDNSTGGGDLVINSVETIAVTAIGEDNDLNIDGSTGTTVTIAGSGELNADFDASVLTVNAASNSGGVTMVASAAGDVTYTGGSGADTFTMGTTLTAADTIAGGTGTDTLGVTGAGGAVIPASAAVTAVEVVAITTGGGDSIDANILTGLTSITTTAAANAHTISVTDATTETFSVTTADADANTDDEIALIDINLAETTGSTDVINLTLTNADNDVAFTVTDIDSTNDGVETLNLTLTQGVEIGTDGAADIIIDDFSSAYTTINITGNADATIAEQTPTTTATVNASTATGSILFELGAANHTVTGGSGGDTFDFNGNLATADTVTGGAGSDTLIATMPASRVSPTVSGVETATLDFNAAGTFAMTNVTGMTSLTLEGAAAHNLVNLDSSVATVVLQEETEDEAVTLTYDAGTSVALTVDFNEVTAAGTETYGLITVNNNAGDFTVDNSDGIWSVNDIVNADTTGTLKVMTSVDAATDTLTVTGTTGIDAINATAVVYETGGSDIAVSGAATHSYTDATSLTFNALDGDININDDDTVVITDADVTVSLTASGGDDSDIDITDLDVDHVTTLTATATNGSDIIIDGEIVFLGVDSTTAASDVSTVFTFEAAGSGSTVDIDDLTVDGAVTLDSLVLKSSDDGVLTFDATDTTLTITSIDATALNGDDFVITFGASSLAAATTIDFSGSTGDDGTYTAGNVGDTITLGAGDILVNLTDSTNAHTVTAGSGVDTFEARGADASEISGFTVGTDKIILDDSIITAMDATNFVDGNGDNITALTGVVIHDATTGADYTMGTATSVLRLSGALADTAAVDAELIARLQESNFADADLITVIWNDGTDAHISAVAIDDVDGINAEVNNVTVNDMLVLVGVDHTTLTATDFGGAFVA
jgi:hypothetical protein